MPSLFRFYLSSLHNLFLEIFIKIVNLINSSSIVLVFVDKDLFIKKYNITTKRLLVLKLLYFADGLPSSFITHYFIVKMTIGYHTEFILFYIIKLSPSTPVILECPGLKNTI